MSGGGNPGQCTVIPVQTDPHAQGIHKVPSPTTIPTLHSGIRIRVGLLGTIIITVFVDSRGPLLIHRDQL
jgi:hypothetical protein